MTQPANPVVQARDVVRTYGDRRALDGFTLSVPRGSVFGLLGPNGSGKSTFVSMLAGMSAPDSGSLDVFGSPPSRRARGHTGTVFQENAQDPLLGVSEYLALAGRLFGVSKVVLRERSAILLAAFGLASRADDEISSLSGGMRRRLEVVRALLHAPELLLLDEPTTGVDADERAALWSALRDAPSGERTVLLATNDLAEADAVCDQVAFVRDGRVVVTGTPDELKRGLRHDAVRVTWADGTAPPGVEVLERDPHVGGLVQDGASTRFTVDDAASFVPRLFAVVGAAIRAIELQPATLEDAYFQHVGRRTMNAAESG